MEKWKIEQKLGFDITDEQYDHAVEIAKESFNY